MIIWDYKVINNSMWRGDCTFRRPKLKERWLSGVAAADEQQCDEGWTKFQGNCYLHFPDRETWLEAEQRCRDLKAHLVSIITPEEQTFVNGECLLCFCVCVKWKRQSELYALLSLSTCTGLSVDRPQRQDGGGWLPLDRRNASGTWWSFCSGHMKPFLCKCSGRGRISMQLGLFDTHIIAN